MADIHSELKSDHDEIKDLLSQISNTTSRAKKTREELYGKLKVKLTTHAKIEEACYYAPLGEMSNTKEIKLEGGIEHRVADGLLADLGAIPTDSDEWGARFKVLKEVLEHHIKEEEGPFFEKSRKALTDKQAEDLGERFRDRSRVTSATLEPIKL